MSNSNDIKPQVGGEQEEQAGLVLTARETQCITQALQGKNIMQISTDLKISPKTVYYYLNGVQMKIKRLNQGAITLTK